jgi:hypothetical protein
MDFLCYTRDSPPGKAPPWVIHSVGGNICRPASEFRKATFLRQMDTSASLARRRPEPGLPMPCVKGPLCENNGQTLLLKNWVRNSPTHLLTPVMLFPRFNLRSILVATTVAALFFLLVGTGYRGQKWAWAAAIGVGSLGLTMLVQVICFGIVMCAAKCVGWMSTARGKRPVPPAAAKLEATT